MIYQLEGIQEIISYLDNTHLMLYDNVQNEAYPIHWHMALEIIMPVDNEYTVCVNDKNYYLKPYDIILICPGVMHRIESPSSGRRIIFQAELSVIQMIFGLNSIVSLLYPATLFTPENAESIHENMKNIILDIADIYSDKKSDNLLEMTIYTKLLQILLLIGKTQIQGTSEDDIIKMSKQQEYVSKFMMVCEYIDTHYQEEITLDDMAAMCDYSKFYFSRLFHEFANMPFYRFVNRRRISRAEELLANENISITSVAIQSGFSNQSAFIRMFKSFNGCTPKEYRKKHESSK